MEAIIKHEGTNVILACYSVSRLLLRHPREGGDLVSVAFCEIPAFAAVRRIGMTEEKCEFGADAGYDFYLGIPDIRCASYSSLSACQAAIYFGDPVR